MKDVLARPAFRPRVTRVRRGEDERAFALLDELALRTWSRPTARRGQGRGRHRSLVEARDAVRAYLSGRRSATPGRTCVIEEGSRTRGLVFVLCDGATRFRSRCAGPQARASTATGAEHRRYGRVLARPVRRDRRRVDEMMADAMRPTLAEIARAARRIRGVLFCGSC
jgi:hypothetical protein